MNNITLLGIDIAKNVFQLHGLSHSGQTVLKKRLSRVKFAEFMTQLPACEVVMECCGTSHYWGRTFRAMGHTVKLISPQHVKAYVKGNKNDKNDAAAILDAARSVTAKFVPVKEVEQQDMQSLLRIRQGFVDERLRLSNQLRGLALESGIFIPKGFTALKKQLPSYFEEEHLALSAMMKEELKLVFAAFKQAEERVKSYDKKIARLASEHSECNRVMALPGVGPKTAVAVVSLGDIRYLRNGRCFAAFLGLVPKQHSSGNRNCLMGISKRGDSYIRELLIHGARSVINTMKDKTDPKSLWLKALVARRGTNRAAVALANKHARVIWQLLAHGEDYKPERITSWKESLS